MHQRRRGSGGGDRPASWTSSNAGWGWPSESSTRCSTATWSAGEAGSVVGSSAWISPAPCRGRRRGAPRGGEGVVAGILRAIVSPSIARAPCTPPRRAGSAARSRGTGTPRRRRSHDVGLDAHVAHVAAPLPLDDPLHPSARNCHVYRDAPPDSRWRSVIAAPSSTAANVWLSDVHASTGCVASIAGDLGRSIRANINRGGAAGSDQGAVSNQRTVTRVPPGAARIAPLATSSSSTRWSTAPVQRLPP